MNFKEFSICLCVSYRLSETPSDLFNSLKQEMDTSNPAVIVNGDMLKTYVGRRVRTVIQDMQQHGGGDASQRIARISAHLNPHKPQFD